MNRQLKIVIHGYSSFWEDTYTTHKCFDLDKLKSEDEIEEYIKVEGGVNWSWFCANLELFVDGIKICEMTYQEKGY